MAIKPDCLYSFREFEQETGIKRAGVRSLRRSGMPVRYVAGQIWIWGGDFVDHVRTNGKRDKDEEQNNGQKQIAPADSTG